MKAFDFFCGAGGLTRGLLDAGIEVLRGIDIDGRCQTTFEYNNPSVEFTRADVTELTPKSVGLNRRSDGYNDILFGGCAPCQPFSTQRKGNRNQVEATLLGQFGRLVEEILPRFVLIENVPGIARIRGFSTFRRFLKMLYSNRYRFVVGILNAKHYGVPQNRRRLILLAIRKQQPSLPSPTHGDSYCALRTVRQAISHFPKIVAGEHHPHIPNHVAASITTINMERLRATPYDGGDRRSWPEHLELQCHKGNYRGHTDVYGRMSWDRPSPALTGRCHSISNGRYGHPSQDRAISLREAAALQSFQDEYFFFGKNKHIAKQIGNAIPVKLAENLGRHLIDSFLP